MLSTKEIEEFKSKGYVVIRNFINQDEIKELSSSFQKSKKSKEDEEAYNVIDDEYLTYLENIDDETYFGLCSDYVGYIK